MQFDLGTGIVLDAHNMYEGMYIEIQDDMGKKRLFVISKIEDDTKIIMRPLTLWERFTYHVRKHKVLATISLVFLIVLGIIVVRLLKG